MQNNCLLSAAQRASSAAEGGSLQRGLTGGSQGGTKLRGGGCWPTTELASLENNANFKATSLKARTSRIY